MGNYYNKSRMSISVNLGNGQAVLVKPKSVLTVDPQMEGAPDLLSKVAQGDLVRILTHEPVATPLESAPAPEAALLEVPTPKVALEATNPGLALVEHQSGFKRKNRRNH